MKTFRKVTISRRKADTAALIIVMKDFCSFGNSYRYLEQESAQYAQAIGAPSCMIAGNGGKCADSWIALSAKTNNSLEVTNIVPDAMGKLSLDAYNDVAKQFALDLRAYSRGARLGLNVKCSGDELSKEDLLRDKRVVTAFDRFMAVNPKSSHPSDIRRLDQFTCTLFKYGRNVFYTDNLRAFLIDTHGLSASDAGRIAERVEIGLEVLAAYRGRPLA